MSWQPLFLVAGIAYTIGYVVSIIEGAFKRPKEDKISE